MPKAVAAAANRKVINMACRIPDAVIAGCLLPFLKQKNDLRLNGLLQKEGRDFAVLASTCKQFRHCAESHLTHLKQEYVSNKEDFQRLKNVKKGLATPIHVALICQDVPQFLSYLRNGADINQRDAGKNTVLNLAEKLKRTDFLKIIQLYPK
jgi:ankyrin repeat protein